MGRALAFVRTITWRQIRSTVGLIIGSMLAVSAPWIDKIFPWLITLLK